MKRVFFRSLFWVSTIVREKDIFSPFWDSVNITGVVCVCRWRSQAPGLSTGTSRRRALYRTRVGISGRWSGNNSAASSSCSPPRYVTLHCMKQVWHQTWNGNDPKFKDGRNQANHKVKKMHEMITHSCWAMFHYRVLRLLYSNENLS